MKLSLNFMTPWLTVTLGMVYAAQAPKTFSTPLHAADALMVAAQQPGIQPLVEIFGEGARDLLPDDPDLKTKFIQALRTNVRIETDPDNPAITWIELGASRWPFPIPLVMTKNGAWQFDAVRGRQEIAARRIGENETDAIRVCLGFVDVQERYAARDRNDDDVLEYAQRILSTPGKKDGLYWEGDDALLSGSLAKALASYSTSGAKKEPFRGYYFKILKAQGLNAPGGARSYMVQNKWMMGGYALLAWPAEYGVSGVRSFIVSYYGVVYQKDLGLNTAASAASMTRFDPDRFWTEVEDPDGDDGTPQ